MKWQLSQRGRIATVFAFVFAVSLLFSHTVSAATYYLATNGNDANSCATAQSSTTPKKSFSSVWSCFTAGDTLMVADGTYTQTSPPAGKSGSAGNVITIKATNDGGAILSGGVVFHNNSYLEYQGFKFVNASGEALTGGSNGTGLVSHHNTFRRCGFTTTSSSIEYGGIDLGDGDHHFLFEDFWVWGGGRYSVMLYGGSGGNPPNTTADYNTFRRGVIRQGPGYSSGGNPEASLALYYASNNIVENVIALDGNQDSDSSNAAFYLTGHAPPPNTSNNKFYGVIALNNKGAGFYLDVDNNEYAQNNAVYNSVFWKQPEGGVVLYANNASRCTGIIIDHIISGENGGDGGFWNYCNGTVVKSSIFQHNTTGMTQGGQGSMGTHNWNLLYNNTSGAYSGITAGANDKTVNPQLSYIARTEAGTPCKGAGESGTDCGADVTKRYQDGVETAVNLWPWPYEERIKKEMCTDAGVTTGFCSDSSLTHYIMNQLGNGDPYSGTSTPTSCNTITTANFSQSLYNSYGAPFDAFQTSTNLLDAKCTSSDPHTMNLTIGITGDTTRIVYTKGYWYDAVTTAWRQYTGTCTGALNGEWCQGSVSATITDPNVSTASSTNPTYLVGMTCSVQGGSWKCGCRDTTCSNFSWQIQGAGR